MTTTVDSTETHTSEPRPKRSYRERAVTTYNDHPVVGSFLMLWAVLLATFMYGGGAFFGGILWTAFAAATIVFMQARKWGMATLMALLLILTLFFRTALSNFFAAVIPDDWSLPNFANLPAGTALTYALALAIVVLAIAGAIRMLRR